ncbi:unnamed protein product [Sphagnum balticum]
MEKQEIVKKNFKASKFDILNFVNRGDRKQNQKKELSNLVTPESGSLDSESVSILHHLLKFTDKEELFRVLLKKPLKEKHSKKLVRLAIIPTDVEDSDNFDIKKKTYL